MTPPSIIYDTPPHYTSRGGLNEHLCVTNTEFINLQTEKIFSNSAHEFSVFWWNFEKEPLFGGILKKSHLEP